MKFNVVEIGPSNAGVLDGWMWLAVRRSYRLLKRRGWRSGNAKVDKIEELLQASIDMDLASMLYAIRSAPE